VTVAIRAAIDAADEGDDGADDHDGKSGANLNGQSS